MPNPSWTPYTARTATLDQASRQAIIALCTGAHGEDFSPLFSYLPDDGLHVLGFSGETLIGHAVVTTRWAQPERLPILRTAYVDAVATLPAYQGQGYGKRLMRHLAGCIADYEIACLHTDRNGFYERIGWETWRGPLAGRGEAGLLPTPEEAGRIMILRLPRTPPLDPGVLLTIEQAGRIW